MSCHRKWGQSINDVCTEGLESSAGLAPEAVLSFTATGGFENSNIVVDVIDERPTRQEGTRSRRTGASSSIVEAIRGKRSDAREKGGPFQIHL